MRIEPAQLNQLDQIAAIEQASFTDPWSRGSLLDEIQKGRLFCALQGDRVAGSIVLWMLAGDCEIASLAAAPDWRRQGVASRLLAFALGQGAEAYYLEVRRSNTAARSLYDRHGFKEIGHRKNYYRKPLEDAILLSYVSIRN